MGIGIDSWILSIYILQYNTIFTVTKLNFFPSLIQSSVSNIPEFDREEEQKVWESRLEEYCIAREEGLEVLKKNGVDLKVICKRNQRSKELSD